MTTPTQFKQYSLILTKGYNDYQKNLRRFANTKTSDKSLSDDLIQHTYLKTWKYLVKGGKVHMMEAFLYHVLRELIIDEYRKQKTVSLDTLLEKGFDIGADTTNRMVNTIDGVEAVALIEKLPATYRKVLRMRFVKELTLTEIALITGQTKNTVAVQLHRGLKKLRVLYIAEHPPVYLEDTE